MPAARLPPCLKLGSLSLGEILRADRRERRVRECLVAGPGDGDSVGVDGVVVIEGPPAAGLAPFRLLPDVGVIERGLTAGAAFLSLFLDRPPGTEQEPGDVEGEERPDDLLSPGADHDDPAL